VEARKAVAEWTRDNRTDAATLELEKTRLASALQEDEKELRDAQRRLSRIRGDLDALVPRLEALEEEAKAALPPGAPAWDRASAGDRRARSELLRSVGQGDEGPAGAFDVRRALTLGFVLADARVAELTAKAREQATTPKAQQATEVERDAAAKDVV